MKATWEDDRDPLAALRKGDPAPFEAFVRAELETFLGFYRRLGAEGNEAQDLVQDLYLRMFRHAPTYRPQGRFAAYAFRVARNLWIDRARRRAGVGEGRGEESEDRGWVERLPDRNGEEPGAGVARAEELERLRAALSALPERHRLVFELGVMQELPYQEIGSILHVPVGTVKSRMFHAVRKLRAALGSPAEEERPTERSGERSAEGEQLL